MSINLATIKTVFDIFLKIKEAFINLRKSDIFLKETELNDLIEKYFSFEQLPKGEVKLTGKLSNFTITNNFPVYSPINFITDENILKKREYNIQKNNIKM